MRDSYFVTSVSWEMVFGTVGSDPLLAGTWPFGTGLSLPLLPLAGLRAGGTLSQFYCGEGEGSSHQNRCSGQEYVLGCSCPC